ncbi:MAG TPA: FdtA/QdtA family cupin domain-containing protein [Candidatus Saccharimonadales bacterium]|nr:FdtA/QdtA family cupin domain-containing protein [Candidatus Saccharimonadales bacterium]
MSKPFEKFDLKNIPTEKFLMTPLELHEYFDFEVKRIYFITDIKSFTGEHCHKEEKEFFVIIQGSCTAIIDKGNGKEDVSLEGPKEAIYVPNYVWHGFRNFSENAILLAISSTNYKPDRSDYIEDYDEYLKIRDEHLSQ